MIRVFQARRRSARVAEAIGVRLGIADATGNPARDGLGTDVSWKVCICTDTSLSWGWRAESPGNATWRMLPSAAGRVVWPELIGRPTGAHDS